MDLKFAPLRESTLLSSNEEFKGRGDGADIPWVTDAIASDGDAGMIRIVFIRWHLTPTMVWQISFCLWAGMS